MIPEGNLYITGKFILVEAIMREITQALCVCDVNQHNNQIEDFSICFPGTFQIDLGLLLPFFVIKLILFVICGHFVLLLALNFLSPTSSQHTGVIHFQVFQP